MADEPIRTHTFSWADPAIFAEATKSLSGREMLEAIRDGRLPKAPFSSLTGIVMIEVAEGRVVFQLNPAEYHYNPLGVVHGGVVATLLDSAMACAIQTLLPPATGCPTLELKTNFIRAITREAGPLRGEGWVIHCGKQTAVAEGRVVDGQGKLFAHATTTCLITRRS